ncbi:unnamed protein product [Linum tenue]|uniref:Binding protein n=1 Tax=Linum tenue TaxID=586396 RepID=A0AAV0HYM8_9ROSI|nr:unnamed protein product [Linum tenue]
MGLDAPVSDWAMVCSKPNYVPYTEQLSPTRFHPQKPGSNRIPFLLSAGDIALGDSPVGKKDVEIIIEESRCESLRSPSSPVLYSSWIGSSRLGFDGLEMLFVDCQTAKENFELALEADNSNTHARYWLSKLHMKYHVPGACKAIGAALLVEAAEMGDPDAQYDLGCHLRVENDWVQSDQQAFFYLEKAVDQLHPGALYLLGAVYLTGDCVKKDVASAIWCFHRASEKGHAGAAIAYGSLLLRGEQVPEAITRLQVKRGTPGRRAKTKESSSTDPVELAKQQFEAAANAGCDLGLKWLQRLEEAEERLLAETTSPEAVATA